jgi:carbonic anhydrase/acetyltransferase-like protein (isoleucine patch superfamily)
VIRGTSIIGNECWINHGAIMHGTQIGDGGAVGLNTACDYGTQIGKGAILANGSATRVGQVIPDNSFAEGLPADWTHYEAGNIEASIRKKLGLQAVPFV